MAHKVMVVEDDQPTIEMMDLLIRRLGYEPVLEPEGAHALMAMKEDPPELVLLDIMMAPVDGFEILRRIRAEDTLREIPVILFTAAPEVEEKVAQIRDPRLSVLHKPVSLEELRNGIRNCLPAA